MSMRCRSTLVMAFLLAISTIVATAGPAFAVGDITGTVTTELGGLPIGGICVEAHDSVTEGTILGFDTTAADGTYTIGALANADYKVFFYDDDPGMCGTQTPAGTPEVTAEGTTTRSITPTPTSSRSLTPTRPSTRS